MGREACPMNTGLEQDLGRKRLGMMTQAGRDGFQVSLNTEKPKTCIS